MNVIKNSFVLLLFGFINVVYAQLPNDCINSVTVCGNSNLNFDVDGFGVQETTSNTCSSGENNSLWLQVTPATSGTLGFTLTPDSSSISIDYDFFVFGPNVTCGNLGNAIRCSTTNPQSSNQGNNLTGMNGTETDTSEGPGPNGNSFVRWLDVNAGETYYIMIDRPIGSSPFSLEWTGTATFSNPPTNELPAGTNMNIEECDLDNDGLVTFDLTQFETDLVGTQTVNVSYFATSQDAELNITPIATPNAYNFGTGTAYVRLTDPTTGCYSVFDINLTLLGSLVVTIPDTMHQCNTSGFAEFDLTQNDDTIINGQENMQVSYYFSENDAINANAPLLSPYTNVSNPQTIWIRLEDTISGCYGIASFSIEVSMNTFTNAEPNFVDTSLIYCQDTYPNTIELSVVLENNDIANYTFLWSTGATSPNISVNLAGDYSVDVFNDAGCFNTKTFTVIGSSVFSSTEPNFVDEEIYYCLDTYPDFITLDSGIENNDITNFTYEWLPNNETTPSILVNEIGDYTVNVYNADNCFTSRVIHVLLSEKPTIERVEIADTKYPDRFHVQVLVTGQGDYIYGLDIDPLDIDNDDLFQTENYFENVRLGAHIVTVKDKNGCSLAQENILILDYPKFLTPNNDGKYDTWNIDNINTLVKYKAISNIFIFDRYGTRIAEINPRGLGWNGMYNGQKAAPDDYWFVVELQDYSGKRITKRGHFSLN